MNVSLRRVAAAGLLLASACGRPPLPGPFTRQDIAAIADPEDGAEVRVQILYHWFKPNRDPQVRPPAWLDAEMPSLLKAAYHDPEDGVLTEAQLWQAPNAVLYSFFETTRKTFPAVYGGFLVKPASLARDFRNESENMKFAVGRLRSLHLERSLGGRGRRAIALMEDASSQIDGLAGSLSAGDDSRFAASVLAVAYDARRLEGALKSAPR
ncbi:MAG: hypothetical protein HKL90_09800 [Elusimicrobia bacterium]|nr:hypothetical protein [Elusimicrobiota bacterium]